MSDEKRTVINETVKNLKQLDLNGLIVVKNASDTLRARQLLEEQEKPEKQKTA